MSKLVWKSRDPRTLVMRPRHAPPKQPCPIKMVYAGQDTSSLVVLIHLAGLN